MRLALAAALALCLAACDSNLTPVSPDQLVPTPRTGNGRRSSARTGRKSGS